jgi:hypothetical protein
MAKKITDTTAPNATAFETGQWLPRQTPDAIYLPSCLNTLSPPPTAPPVSSPRCWPSPTAPACG